jgi:ribulose-phosphate 3-epimerase
MHRLDLILLMSVNPGFGGQQFLPATIAKIQALRSMIDRHQAEGGHRIVLQVDGGIKIDNIREVALAGADCFVAGSAVFSSPDPDGHYRQVIKQLRQAIDGVHALSPNGRV